MDFSFKDLTQGASSNFPVADQLAMYKDDILDTMRRQAEVLEVIIDMHSINDGEDLRGFCEENFPIRFDYDDRVFTIEYDDSNQELVYYQVNQNNVMKIGSQDISGDVAPDTFSFNYGDNLTAELGSNVISYLSDSIACSDIMNTFIDSALNKPQSDGSIISDFNAATAGLRGKSTAIDNTIDNLSNKLNSFGNNQSGALSTVVHVFKEVVDAVISGGEIRFNDASFYVQGFAFSHAIKTVLASGATIIAAIVASLNPVIGYTLLGLGTVLSNAMDGTYLRENSKPTINYDANNRLFAMPVMQAEDTKDSLVYIASIYLPDYYEDFIQLLGLIEHKGGCVTCHMASVDLLVWFNSNSNKYCWEVYLQADGIRAQSYAYMCNASVSDNALTWSNSFHIPPGNWGGDDDVVSARGLGMHDWVYKSYIIGKDEQPKSTILTERSQLGYIFHSLEWLIAYLHGGFNNVTLNVSGTEDQQLAYWLWKCSNPNSLDYGDLVNDIIPAVRSLHCGALSDRVACILLIKHWFDLVNMTNVDSVSSLSRWYKSIFYCLNNNGSDVSAFPIKANIPLFYLPDRGNAFVSPPAYDSWALFRTRMLVIGIAAVALTVFVTKAIVKKKLKRYMRDKYLDVQKANTDYATSRTDENWNKVKKAEFRYNLLASFTGYPKLQVVSGWEGGGSSASGGTFELLYKILTNLVTPMLPDDTEAEQLTLADIRNLIK